jgi:hypothetical protein
MFDGFGSMHTKFHDTINAPNHYLKKKKKKKKKRERERERDGVCGVGGGIMGLFCCGISCLGSFLF